MLLIFLQVALFAVEISFATYMGRCTQVLNRIGHMTSKLLYRGISLGCNFCFFKYNVNIIRAFIELSTWSPVVILLQLVYGDTGVGKGNIRVVTMLLYIMRQHNVVSFLTNNAE